MNTAIAEREALDAKSIEQVLVGGDLAKLTPDQRLSYYNRVCTSLGLNPLTKPFAYITLNGKLQLYALKDATEQLRKIHSVSITEVTSQRIEDVFVVTAKAQDKTGRTDAATGAVAVGNLKGEALANALMKAETKAKRRATLSICGLGMLDETEVLSIPGAELGEPQPSDATWKASAADRKARKPVPDGVLFIEEIVPKSKGNREWADVTMSNGEVVVATAQLIPLAYNIAQENAPVELRKHTNTKGNQQLDSIDRWSAVVVEEPTLPLPELKADDIAF